MFVCLKFPLLAFNLFCCCFAFCNDRKETIQSCISSQNVVMSATRTNLWWNVMLCGKTKKARSCLVTRQKGFLLFLTCLCSFSQFEIFFICCDMQRLKSLSLALWTVSFQISKTKTKKNLQKGCEETESNKCASSSGNCYGSDVEHKMALLSSLGSNWSWFCNWDHLSTTNNQNHDDKKNGINHWSVFNQNKTFVDCNSVCLLFFCFLDFGSDG